MCLNYEMQALISKLAPNFLLLHSVRKLENERRKTEKQMANMILTSGCGLPASDPSVFTTN
jgi:hypothetical protein